MHVTKIEKKIDFQLKKKLNCFLSYTQLISIYTNNTLTTKMDRKQMNREQKLAYATAYAHSLSRFESVEFEEFIDIMNEQIQYSIVDVDITQGELSIVIQEYGCEVDNYTFNEKDGVIASCQYFVFINDEGQLEIDDDFDYDTDYVETNETEYVLK